MSQEVTSVNKTPTFRSVIQVDKDVAFVVDTRDLEYPVTVPSDKNIGFSRKTYSKKHPTNNPCVSYMEDAICSVGNDVSKRNKQPFKNSKCSSNSTKKTSKVFRKKRPANSEAGASKSPVPKKMRKRDVSGSKTPPTKVNGRINNKLKPKSVQSSQIHEASPASDEDSDEDSDVEIVAIKTFLPGSSDSDYFGENDSNSFCSREKSNLNDFPGKNSMKPLTGILKKSSYPIVNGGVSFCHANASSFLPSKSSTNISFNESVSDTSPTKWLSVNGTIGLSSIRNGGATGAKGSELKNNLNESDIKDSPEKKNKGGRELKGLYENLNEISWASEKSFQQMLTKTDNRHSERITAKAIDMGKSLRRIKSGVMKKLAITANKRKPGLAKKNTVKLALKRAKYGKPKPKISVKPNPKQKVAFKVNKITKSVGKSNKNAKSVKPNKKILKVAIKKTAQPKNGPKVKATVVKQKPQNSATSVKSSKVMNSSQKNVINCSQSAGKSGVSSAFKNILKNENVQKLCSKKTPLGNVMKQLDSVEVSNELAFFSSCFGNDEKRFTALKKGSKLRVAVEPLEHTKLWNADFYEAFKKHVLEKAVMQTYEGKDQDSINAVFQSIQDSCFNSNNIKAPKKRKAEEETLRSSVRQSEGAFRYKEIVVKKHENYMQFVLVPNACKRNSLSIEAMKELREAFALAQRDPNCKAVLLNSSGTYFCTGIDLSLLVGNNRKQLAEEMSASIRDLILALSTFTKPVIAAVNGTAVGLGVGILTYCDVVLASDKATFCIPATRLGYVPEGAITLTLPQVVGSSVATEMLLYGRRLTAEQALRHGLVSEVLWPTQLMNEVVPRIQTIASQPLPVMEATKLMVRCHLWDKLKKHIEREYFILPPLWLDNRCQNNIKRTLQTGWLID